MDDLVQVNGVDYYVTVQGHGRPLVLLHGFTGSSANWEGVTAVLAPHFRLLTIDLLGHGRTSSLPDPARYQMEKAAADVTALIQKILTAEDAKNAERTKTPRSPRPQRFNLLGYSMGGRLALYIALRYPHLINALILESASPGLATETERAARRQRDEALANRVERDGVPAFVDFWEKLSLWESQKQLPEAPRLALRRQRLQNNPTGLANSLRGMGTGAQPSLWSRLGELETPVLLLAGELDAKFVGINRQMAAQIPRARLEIVAGAGHTIHLERPQVFDALVGKFLGGG
ncbi:MAG: 2-succinyl-6-hydroxy-2,4-cyclohexadiene-1-carboxylate synthase [Anaerolineae bacterium]